MSTNQDDPKAGASAPTGNCAEKLGEKGVHLGSEAYRAAATDFSGLVLSLGEAAMIEMGLERNPEAKAVVRNLNMAQQTIDILRMLKEKTAGNLTTGEQKLLEGILYQVHLCFVEAKTKGKG